MSIEGQGHFLTLAHSVHESCQHFTGHSVRQSMKVCLTDKKIVCPKNSALFGKKSRAEDMCVCVCVCVCGGGGAIINFL